MLINKYFKWIIELNNPKQKINGLVILFIFLPFNFLFAEEKEMDMAAYTDTAFLVFFIFMIFLTFIFMLYHGGVKRIPMEVSAWEKIKGLFFDTKPIENENEILLDHEYDGIKELDNSLPPWWKYLFYVTIVWAVIYMGVYHVFGTGKLMEEEYAEEMEIAELQKAEMLAGGKFIDENSVTELTDPGSLFSGKEVYSKYCAACHGNFGEGLVGPNFTDEFWMHGGGIKNIFLITKNGVPDKGMISWKSQLSPKEMQEVGSYILSFKGTNPSNQKLPQGDKWVE